jgi:magnesium chelatase family protein
MTISVKTVAFEGIEIIEVEAQVHITSGMPSFTIVGLGDKAVRESKDRIKAALQSIGITIPAKKITINLSPSDIEKNGAHFDLPIALALLAALNLLPHEEISKYIVLGELALDGRILPILGTLPAAIYANSVDMGVICPKENGSEAALASSEIDIIAPLDLTALINHIRGIQLQTRPKLDPSFLTESEEYRGDFFDVRGQFAAKRALEIAAAGSHNLLMYGPPGTGKSMLASRILSIMPQMSSVEILQTSIIKSIAGELKNGSISSSRPFRDPHHSSSMPAMIGGGKNANPGEISLAHNGILFLDELAEFPKSLLDSLRQPIENGYINVSRVNKHVRYPAKFQLIAAMNPCKCGYFGNESKQCKKTPNCAIDYQSRVSGPIMDRIDLHVQVSNFAPTLDDNGSDRGEKSSIIKARILKARKLQAERYLEIGIEVNDDLIGDQISYFCKLDDKAKPIMQNAIEKLDLSMRSHNKILKVARTIADLKGSNLISDGDLFEALSYRAKVLNK